MTPRLGTTLLCAIVLLVLIPALNLLPRVTQLSTWLVNSSTALFSPPQIQGIDGIVPDTENELKYRIDNVTYFTPTHDPVQVIPFVHFANALSKEQKGYFPLTVLRLPMNEVVLDYTTISNVIDEYLLMDDVLTPAWLENLVLVPNNTFRGETSTITFIDKETFARLNRDYNVKRVFVDPTYTLPRPVGVLGTGTEIDRIIPTSHPFGYLRGPYLGSVNKDADRVELWPVYRLYSDIYRTFLFGMYKPLPYGDDPRYQALRAVDERGYNLIPIPSRLSTPYMKNGKGPLRIGVKDVYDIKGVPTSAGSRAYGNLYGPANQTAISLRILDPETAVLVGKTKTTAFAARGFGHEDHVDEQLPFSPRGDGWQNCMWSSTGSSCAVAAYDWLDLALGTDTGGSVRVPAAVIGLYGNRFTPGTIPLANVIPCWEYADAAGVVARDPKIFVDFIATWSSLSISHRAPAATLAQSLAGPTQQIPRSLLVATDYLTQTNPTAQQVVDEWLMTVRDTLGLDVDKIILDNVFEDAGYTADSIQSIHTTMVESVSWWSWSKVGKQFVHDYAARHNGQEPGVDPIPRNGWRRARKSGSWEKYRANADRFIEFQEWFANNIFKENETHCADRILISSMGMGGWPRYRETELNQDIPERRTRFEGRDLCTYAGCVDYIIPIGQVPYFSKVSNVVEQTAVTINLIASRHCDSAVLRFIDKLAEAGLIGTVKTGRTAF